jgi:hypothetical protein
MRKIATRILQEIPWYKNGSKEINTILYIVESISLFEGG